MLSFSGLLEPRCCYATVAIVVSTARSWLSASTELGAPHKRRLLTDDRGCAASRLRERASGLLAWLRKRGPEAAPSLQRSGQFMATGLGAPGPGRFAAADAVVRAPATVNVGHGDSADTADVQRPARLPAAAPARVAAVPGVLSAVGDVSFPLAVIGRDRVPLPRRGGAPPTATAGPPRH